MQRQQPADPVAAEAARQAKLKELAEERKTLELAYQVAVRDEKHARSEMKELETTAKEHDEQLSQLKDRVAAVTAELSQLKLNSSLAEALVEEAKHERSEDDPNLEITTLRDISGTINKAFRQAMTKKLGDQEYIDRLGDQNTGSRPEFCRVRWGEESADWKVHDPRDGTEVSFGGLLQDVSRYWGLDHTEMGFTDANGASWPLELYPWDELGPTGDVSVTLARRPRTAGLEALHYEYEEDESALPLAVRRRRDRERRAKQVVRHTREMIRKQEARERAAVFRELVKYSLMMILYYMVLLTRREVRDAFLMTAGLRTVFVEENFGDANIKTFEDIRTYEELYEWANGPFTEGLLPAEYYDGSEIPESKKAVAYYNRVVGGLRMRQVKVTPNRGCRIALNVQTDFTPSRGPDAGIKRTRKYVQQCFSAYQSQGAAEDLTWKRAPFAVMQQTFTNTTGPAECRAIGPWSDTYYLQEDASREDYDLYHRCLGAAYYDPNTLVDPETGLTNVTDPLKLAFTWRTAEENSLGGFRHAGRFGTYDGSGYVFDLTNLTTTSLAESFAYLEEHIWLDRETRALTISLVVYNANFNMYGVCNFRLELSLAGVLIPSYEILTVKMDQFKSFLDTTQEKVKLVIEGVLYTGMVYYLLNEFVEVYSIYTATGSPLGYFTDFWNVIDWLLIVLSFIALMMRVLFSLRDEVVNFSAFGTDYVELTAAASQYNSSFAFDAIAASFGIFKIFRFFDLQRNLLILRKSIEKGLVDLLFFTLMLLIFMLGFAFAGNNIFGQETEEYVSPGNAFVTLFLTVLGEFEFDTMIRIQPLFAYMYFLLYQIFVFLIMLNISLAILNDAYLDVKGKFDREAVDDGPPPPTLRERIRHLRTWWRQRKLDRRIEWLRKQQRQRELVDRRAQRKVEEQRAKTLKAMGMDVTSGTGGGSGGSGGGAPRANGAEHHEQL